MGGTGLGFVGFGCDFMREIWPGYYMGIIMHTWEIHTLIFIPMNNFPSLGAVPRSVFFRPGRCDQRKGRKRP